MSFLKNVHPANEMTGAASGGCCANDGCCSAGPPGAELNGRRSKYADDKDGPVTAAGAVAAAHAKNEKAKGPPKGASAVPIVENKCCMPKGKNDKCFATGSDAECCPRAIESKECCLEGDSCYNTPDPEAGTGEKGCCMGGQSQKDGACCVPPAPKKKPAPKVAKTGVDASKDGKSANDTVEAEGTESAAATAGKGVETGTHTVSDSDPKQGELSTSTSAAYRAGAGGDVDAVEHSVATAHALPHATATPHAPLGNLTVPTGGLTGSTGSLNSPTGGLSSPTGNLNGPTGSYNGPTGGLSSPTGNLNGSTGGLSSPTGNLNGPTGGLSSPTGNLNGPTGGLNGPTGSFNGPTGTAHAPANMAADTTSHLSEIDLTDRAVAVAGAGATGAKSAVTGAAPVPVPAVKPQKQGGCSIQ